MVNIGPEVTSDERPCSSANGKWRSTPATRPKIRMRFQERPELDLTSIAETIHPPRHAQIVPRKLDDVLALAETAPFFDPDDPAIHRDHAETTSRLRHGLISCVVVFQSAARCIRRDRFHVSDARGHRSSRCMRRPTQTASGRACRPSRLRSTSARLFSQSGGGGRYPVDVGRRPSDRQAVAAVRVMPGSGTPQVAENIRGDMHRLSDDPDERLIRPADVVYGIDPREKAWPTTP